MPKCTHTSPKHICTYTHVLVSLEPMSSSPFVPCWIEFQEKFLGGFILTVSTSDMLQSRLSCLGSHISNIPQFRGQYVGGKEHGIQSRTDLYSCPGLIAITLDTRTWAQALTSLSFLVGKVRIMVSLPLQDCWHNEIRKWKKKHPTAYICPTSGVL